MLAFICALLGRVNTLITRLTATRAANLDYLDGAISTISPIRSIQPGVITVSGTNTTGTATISAVTVAKAYVVFGGYDSAVATPWRVSLTNSTTVTADRFTGTSGSSHVNFTVVEFK